MKWIIVFLSLNVLVLWFRWKSKSFIAYQQNLYYFHNNTFFPFDKFLKESEKTYIHKCIDMSYYELFRILYIFIDPLIHRSSFFTYSHQVIDGNVNSGRIAYGSTICPKTAQIYAEPILRERGIVLPLSLDNPNLTFSGLGWDFGNRTFRVYIRYADLDKLPEDHKKMAEKGDYYKMGLLSWSFGFDGKLEETKIYQYPVNKPFIQGIQHTTILNSNKRKHVSQHDTCRGKSSSIWKDKLNSQGKDIIDHYEKEGHDLDTIVFNDSKNYTIYFPQINC